jgi:CBS domain-containing protein
VPHLRRRGIRTLGEAEAACRSMAAAMAAAGRPGPGLTPTAPSRAPLARVDAFAFSHRCRDLMSTPARTIAGDRPLSEAVEAMAKGRISSLLVTAAEGQPPYGIATERDVMRALAADGAAALDRPVASVASSPLITVAADDFVFRAIGRMTRGNIRHLAVADDGGSVVGALSARDLMRLRSSGALTLGDEVASAVDSAALAAAFARLPAVAIGLLDDGVAAIDVAAVISDEIGAMTARAGELAAAQLGEAGHGPPPADYAIAVLGSAGRGESLLAADQDNAVIHADTDSPEAEPWFAELGRRLADILDEAGIPYCKGGVMASNAAWRGSVSDWQRRVATWIGRSSARDLLNVDIFFDLLPVAGASQLAQDVWRNAYAAAEGEVAFLKLLAESLAGFSPPFTLFGRLRTDAGRVDLKAAGLFPIVSSARLLSLRYGVLARDTSARLLGVRALDVGSDADIERLVAVHRLLVELILRQQIEDLAAGVPPSTRVAPARLSASRRSEMKEALADLRHLDTTVRDLLFG